MCVPHVQRGTVFFAESGIMFMIFFTPAQYFALNRAATADRCST
jgi:hypothetical protein